MIKQKQISAFTPSNTDTETRERIFVQRHQLLRRVVSWCEESMLTGDKHHLLFIGPRGSGKTHLVSMAHDRLTANAKLNDAMRIAWLGEDSIYTGLIDFALEIADELSRVYPDEFKFDYRASARSLANTDDAAELILDEIVRRLGSKSILLIMENLDQAFRGLGDTGQKKWRAFLQEKARVATLATSQQLFQDVSSRNAAFYGFFEIIHLEPLSVDDANELMSKIAHEHENQKLAQFLRTAEGRHRVRALHHLAGGNHRIYVMLSEFLTQDSLDDLVAAFEQLAEDLTPYYQERVRALSPQQARIVQSLCCASGALSVKEIAQDTFVAERNVAKQLGDLKQKGYVISTKRGKESFYEMAEPLMRLSLEVKRQRGKPLRSVAAFLRVWYPAGALQQMLADEFGMASNNTRSLAYGRAALLEDDAFAQGNVRQSYQEFDAGFGERNFDGAMPVAEKPVSANHPTGLRRRSEVLQMQNELIQALEEANHATSLDCLRREFAQGDAVTEECGWLPGDLLRMVLGRKPSSWAAFIDAIVLVCAKHGILDDLGGALTASIAAMDASGYSSPQLDRWNSTWQDLGAEYDELAIALSTLDVAVQVIKTGKDRALFRLPLEIREIVRPLLINTLPKQ